MSRQISADRSLSPVSQVKEWGEFVKISHTVFALPFALASMALAARENRGWPGLRLFSLILLAMITARTCAMSFNRIADREFDRANPRTRERHLPSGKISLAGAWSLCLVSAGVFIAVTYSINTLCFFLSPIALLIVCFYSLTKRFTDFTHLYLGMALALAPIGAWLAVRGSFQFAPMATGALLPLILAAAVVFWLIGFDIIYAVQDYEFDRAHGLHSLVVRWGVANALEAAMICHFLMWGFLMMLGFVARFKIAYYAGLILIIGCLVVEHWLARRRGIDWIQNAFFRLNALISMIFLGVTLAEVVFPFFSLRR